MPSSDPISTSAKIRRHLFLWLIFLTLVLIGTVIVLSSATFFFGVPNWALLSEGDVPYVHGQGEKWLGADKGDGFIEVPVPGRGSGNQTMRVKEEEWDGLIYGSEDWSHLEDVQLMEGERIPRIIHQTWKNDVLPERWRASYQECRRGQENFTYHLWTDSASRRFVSEHYPSFLPTYDSYTYPIQRADAIRYFVLHRFGGIYMDFDVGCRRDFSPLLKGDWDVVLAKTIPVGVSNDVMASAKGSAFMDMTIHALIPFNHHWVSNYPTVMFSTGPMFLSAQYSLYTSSHPLTPVRPTLEVRVLPKSLYGKNALPLESPHAFFSHDSASSWHSDDSKFFLFLGQKGIWIVRGGFFCVVVVALRMFWTRGRVVRKSAGGGIRRLVIGLENVAQGGGVAGFSSGIVTGATTPGGGTYQLLSFLPTSLSTSPVSTPSLSLPGSPSMHPSSGPNTLLPVSFDLHSSYSSNTSNSPPNSPPLSSLSLALRKAANSYFLFPSSSSQPSSSSAFPSDPSVHPSKPSNDYHPSSTASSSKTTNTGPRRKSSTKRPKRGVLYFFPAFFAPYSDDDQSGPTPTNPNSASSRTNRKRAGTGRSSRVPPESSSRTRGNSHYPMNSTSSGHPLLSGNHSATDIESGIGEDYSDEDEVLRSPVKGDSFSGGDGGLGLTNAGGGGGGFGSRGISRRGSPPPPPTYQYASSSNSVGGGGGSSSSRAGSVKEDGRGAGSGGGDGGGEEDWDVQWEDGEHDEAHRK